jgi:hypothetical protein
MKEYNSLGNISFYYVKRYISLIKYMLIFELYEPGFCVKNFGGSKVFGHF